MWRPDNWDILKPTPYEPKDGESAWDFYEHGVEAGADAMLEALKGGRRARKDPSSLLIGWWVFIEDEPDSFYGRYKETDEEMG